MWLKFLILILLFFVAVLVQNSFLPHFSILGTTPNLVFILFFTLIFFEKPDEYYQGIFFAIISGFVLDGFSSFPFGLSIILMVAIYFFMKTTVYFLKERQEEYLFVSFIFLFLICLFFYDIFSYIFIHFYHFEFSLSLNVFVGLGYNIVAAFIGFFIYKHINKNIDDRQLTLFR